jgi:signal transduction histidine kinase
MRRLLVVEDSPTQAAALAALLESADYEVDIARSGEAALARLDDNSFDLVISDVVMPGMSGYDLSRTMKEREDLRHTPIVLLTSLADPLDIIRGLECGADNYLTKPYEAEHLLTRLSGVFEHLALRRNRPRTGQVDITFLGTHFTITSEKEQILDLLLSSFEELVRTNAALRAAEAEQARLHEMEVAARLEAEHARKVAEDANKAKSEFLAMMSHDLRTPLNAIGGYADLLSLGVRGPVNDQQEADLERIKRNQRHLLTHVNDVLSFARIERGDIPLNVISTNLNRAIKHLGAMIEPQTRAHGLTYRFVPCDVELHVLADAERVEQIIINLLGNSVKFTPDGGTITLSCGIDAGHPGMARIQVRDTGIGIPEDKLDSVFEPFTQLDMHHEKRDGVGLGLAISRKLTRLMSGDIVAESAPGEGTVLTVWLPLAT